MKFTLCLALLCAGIPSMVIGQTPDGVPTEWDLRKTLESLDVQTRQLQPILEQVKPQEWVERGAPQAYVAQWKTAQDQVQYLLGSSQNFAKQPDRLTLALDTYFRLEAMNTTLASLNEGIRRYQNPAVADLLQSVADKNSANRQHLRQYIVELAGTREQEFKVMEQEAQRCRTSLSRQPAPAHPKKQERP